MNKIKLYHGSEEMIKCPVYGKGRIYNDYGRGFYCTENLELAKEWACTEDCDGYANIYEIDIDNLEILYLSSDKYSILHWLTVLITNRKLRLSTPTMRRAAKWLESNYSIDINKYDAIVGYRADDSYFSFARDFLNNEISLKQLSYAMQLGKLGEQFVLKSKKAFEQLEYLGYEIADSRVYYALRRERDDEARHKYMKTLEEDDEDGIFIRDMMRKEKK